ncbi:MAG: hypothetical protein L6266_00465, partial [Nanoarchaeota archaeon]|nr:hypothetical protein [Nanoarchaeota archaeon]
MFNLKEIKKAVDQIAEEKGLDSEQILTAIESSIAAAYKKEFGKRSEIIKCKFDLKTGTLKFWQIKTVEDENTVKIIEEFELSDSDHESKKKEILPSKETIDDDEEKIPRYNPDRHILIEDAKKINKKIKLEEELEFPLEIHDDFGRIAA